MTSLSPRIYIYKITFEEVLYCYYGVHKEKKFDEYYMGSPVTHKWMWDFYTPKKQILEIFPFTDEGWLEAQEVEGRLIRPVFNTDKWCLNESCMGIFSLEQKSKAGKIGGKITGQIHKENGTGVCGIPIEEKRKNSEKGGKIGGKRNAKNKTGFCGRSKEKMSGDGKICGEIMGQIHKKNRTGVCGIPIEERKKNSKKGGKRAYELCVGVHALTPQQRNETGKKVAYQKWMCLETGFVANAGNLTQYQKARGIDTSKRVKIS
jgi:hypothetical protein